MGRNIKVKVTIAQLDLAAALAEAGPLPVGTGRITRCPVAPDLVHPEPRITRARRGAPETSRDAAARACGEHGEKLTERQGMVLALFQEFGEMTDEQLVERASHKYKWSRHSSSARSRRSELTEKKLIVDTGRTTTTQATGSKTKIWGLPS